ncbi:NAD(P)/FAD-dependent oxidoreductase [Intestinibacillus massiliensis]|uniref:NAD(P)/FAD-dependent oxidoreductase n=1 Tax=Intestinibacillus massiliensis TaxID=1871029 RepID=UPI000B35387F|nr:NAD(P)-binding protein [Intestinibacillus massiliensis]
MSILISGIRLPFDRLESEAIGLARSQYGLQGGEAAIYRQSIDARHGKVTKVYTICVDGIDGEEALVAQIASPSVRWKAPQEAAPVFGDRPLPHRPVVIGTGPAGLFAAYTLAQYGYNPLVFERGDEIGVRDGAVQAFFAGGALDPESNIQFGEGGAGAYSDGKLTTRINDPLCETVLQTFVGHGAPAEILRQAKPHIGTDILKDVVRSMRGRITALGGDVRFRAPLTAIEAGRNGALAGIFVDGQHIACERAVLAIGHSARDTFFMLRDAGVYLEPKPFSVGARIEHLQADVDRMLYGKFAGHPALPPAEYTLSYREGGRACYSFCMCPGGHVVAAQSEPDTAVTNGMSYHARDGRNANAAIVVSVDPADFAEGGALAGIAFQRGIEGAAYRLAGGAGAPCQRVGDFLEGRPTTRLGGVLPTYPRGVVPGRIDPCLPAFITEKMRTGLRAFDRRMHGFAAADAVLTAPETRTSSPVRIKRGEDLGSVSMPGLLPCGEGAGYAGGIMSAAVDGIRVAHRIMSEFAPF